MQTIATLFVAGLILAPVLMQLYVQRLPVAPLCPNCRSVTRESRYPGVLLQVIPAMSATMRGECGSCGWRGRMRWKWAPRSVRRRGL